MSAVLLFASISGGGWGWQFIVMAGTSLLRICAVGMVIKCYCLRVVVYILVGCRFVSLCGWLCYCSCCHYTLLYFTLYTWLSCCCLCHLALYLCYLSLYLYYSYSYCYSYCYSLYSHKSEAYPWQPDISY